MKELTKAKYWIFDLDNTLYSGESKVFEQVNKKMSKYISKKLNISIIEAKKIQKSYFYKFNTTLNGMIKNHQIDANEFLDFVHDVDIDFLKEDRKLNNELKKLIDMMMDQNRELLEYLSPKNWANNIDNKVFIIHGANDSMVPFTESTRLSEAIPNNKMLISFLYEHREISTDRGLFFKIRELIKMVKFFANYFRYNK